MKNLFLMIFCSLCIGANGQTQNPLGSTMVKAIEESDSIVNVISDTIVAVNDSATVIDNPITAPDSTTKVAEYDVMTISNDSTAQEVTAVDSCAVKKEELKSDVILYLEKLAIFKGDSTINDSIKSIIYTSITEYIMDVKDSSENPVSPANPNFLSLVFNEKDINTSITVPEYSVNGANSADMKLDNSYADSFKKSEGEAILDETKNSVVTTSPKNVDYSQSTMPEAPKNEKMPKKKKKEFLAIDNIDVPTTNMATDAPPAPKLWKHSFSSSIQVSEAYISKNWYQGGESNFNLISDQLYNVEYDHNNILFTTGVQWKLGISTTPSDEYHKISINDDLFQINSKLGIKAVKDWYYTVSLLFKTQLFDSYGSNSETRKSAFFSPGEFNLGVGMSYNKKIAERKFETSVMLAPLSYNLKFSLDEELAAKAGIKDGKLCDNQVGSSLEGTFKWEFYPNLTWTSRVFYFTDYKSILADIETGLNFVFNRFFSTKIYLHARYDDSVAKNVHNNHLQFKEMLSFGFNYKFK